ncbi:MAG: hypothetical protein HQL50_11820 [Magnetococcales bacterium]|nr:hypothetical protein [Magnetococcales bacterium]
MTRWREPWLIGLVLVGGVLATSGSAHAYCVDNQTKGPLHVQSLDSAKFQGDAEPGKSICCDRNHCIPKGRSETHLLILTGYVPVDISGKKQPGWEDECRVTAAMADTVHVQPTRDGIDCLKGGHDE